MRVNVAPVAPVETAPDAPPSLLVGSPSPWRARWSVLVRWSATPLGTGVLLAGLMLLSLLYRLEGQRVWLWIDEGLSAGISGHPIRELPELLRQDGSPPLYFALLHFWMRAFGTTEAALHAFSLVFAVACVPAALWAGWSLFGRRVGWTCALLAAANPFLTYYGREARMYTFVAFLAFLAVACYLHAFAFGRRRYLPAFTVLLVLLLYTHNWSLYLVIGAVLALVPCMMLRDDRRTVLRDAVLTFGAAALAFLPWVPTLLFQIAHTGAPWSRPPSLREAISEVDAVLGDERTLVALLLVGGAGLVEIVRRHRSRELTGVVALLVLFVVPLSVSWLSSQLEPNWATRYFAMIVGALLLLTALGLARAGWQGVAALVLIMLFWTHPLGYITGARGATPKAQKSNVKAVALTAVPRLHAGDLVVSTHPEQTPVLHYYMGDGFRYATPTGPVADPTIFDWRDVVARMESASPTRNLAPLIDRLPVGARVLLVGPVGRLSGDRDPEWFVLFHKRTTEWQEALQKDTRLRLESQIGRAVSRVAGTSVYALVFVKVSA